MEYYGVKFTVLAFINYNYIYILPSIIDLHKRVISKWENLDFN